MLNKEKSRLLSAIAQATAYIPIVWPLQQFVATNPLWNHINQPIDKISHDMQHLFCVQSTLTLQEYWCHYTDNRITPQSVQQSILKWLHQHTQTSHNTTDHLLIDLYQHHLFNFMVDKKCIHDLNKYQQSSLENRIKLNKILYSKQVKSYSFDSAYDFVESECLSWLQSYFNPTALQKHIFTKFGKSQTRHQQSQYQFFDFCRAILVAKNKAWQTLLAAYSDDIELLIEQLCTKLAIPDECLAQYIMQICWQLKGWVGYIKWQHQYPNNPYFIKNIEVIEVVALWLMHEVFWQQTHSSDLADFTPQYRVKFDTDADTPMLLIWQAYLQQADIDLSDPQLNSLYQFPKQYQLSINNIYWLWQSAFEIGYQKPLHQSLQQAKSSNIQARHHPNAQWVFCIDVRSEGMRRHLEHVGKHETFGFAGFFGFAYQLDNKNSDQLTNQCPALIEPQFKIEINTLRSHCETITKNLSDIINKNKKNTLSPYALYENLGLWFAFTLMLKNYATSCVNFLKKCCAHSNKPSHDTLGTAIDNRINLADLDMATAANAAGNFLCAIGLVENFADFVIVCGHHAETENNPYQAALDCGACGGNSGMTNAVLACLVLNKPEIREKLAEKNIVIPDNTTFIPACHNTTTDQVAWYDETVTIHSNQQSMLTQIKNDAKAAGNLLRQERLTQLPGDSHVKRRALHWAELIPEWGLANNAAMVVAPRHLTDSLNLKRRVFLHSYQSELDPDGDILESILLGPVVVAHWINIQYYFSSVDPKSFSSGNKAIHNILPRVGVMEGNQSDLKYGLPEQCVFYREKRFHEPIRLTVFIDAEEDKIQSIIARNAVLKSLRDGHWISITSLKK